MKISQQLLAAALAATVVGSFGMSSAGAEGQRPEAQNIILLIGDGMGVTHIDAARQRYVGAAGSLRMETAPTSGSVRTWAVEQNSTKPNLVTDSASAATAWSSGVKTYNAAIGKDAFGNVVPTIMEQAKAAGMRTGNVSTAEITDATPAGMFAHVSQRSCQGPTQAQPACGTDRPVAEQIARNNVADVILGGGLSRFKPDDEAIMRTNGYKVLGSFGDPALPTQTAASQTVPTKADLAAVGEDEQRVIGLFNRGNMTIEKSKRERPDAPQAMEPSVAEMTDKAVQLLSKQSRGGSKGFFLQVEGALIDKRSHANDAAQTLEEVKAFDDAVAKARDFAEKDGNTLVLVTADHECAGFNIIERGSFTNAEAAGPPLNVDSGNTANNSSPGRTTGNTKDALRSSGIVNGAGAADPKSFGPATFRTADDPASVVDGSPEASLWLSYLSGNHTGADVNIYAAGPGSGTFAGRMDNTDIYRKMFAALKPLNPSATGGGGYWMLSAAGTVYPFGGAKHHGNGPAGAVDLVPTPSRLGYWVVTNTGAVTTHGDAQHFGDRPLLQPGETVSSISSPPGGGGYWLFTSRGRVFAYGAAPRLGDLADVTLAGAIVDSTATPSGRGYYMVALDGGIFAFGDAVFSGSTGGTRLAAPVRALAPDPDGKGYWLVASDGGVFAFDAPFLGSLGSVPLSRPVSAMVASGGGYLLAAEDGGAFVFGPGTSFHGSLGTTPPPSPIVAVASL